MTWVAVVKFWAYQAYQLQLIVYTNLTLTLHGLELFSSANRQWVYDTQNSGTLKGEYTVNIPISMNLLGCATAGTGDDSTNIVGWSTTSITVKTFQSHITDTDHQVRRPFHAILIGKN